MRRSISAIIVIAGLQVGYMAYFQNEISKEKFVAVGDTVIGPELAGNEVADVEFVNEPWSWQVFDELSPSSDGSAESEFAHASERSVNSVPITSRRRTYRRGFVQNDVSFTPTIITVAENRPYRFDTHSRPSEPISQPVSDPRDEPVTEPKPKKNIFKKALPVVKKPYDWLKALGSTLR